MIISAISQGKRDKDRVNVSLDGEFAFAIEKKTLAEHMLYQGKDLSAEEVERIKYEDAVSYLLRRVIKFWGRRPRSTSEIRTKLKELIAKRNYEEQEKLNAEVLENLKGMGFSDTEYAEWYVGERARQGKYGSKKLRSELLSKGVDSKLVEIALANLFTEEHAAGIKVLQKKYGVEKLGDIADYNLRSKAYRFLESRGFRASDYS